LGLFRVFFQGCPKIFFSFLKKIYLEKNSRGKKPKKVKITIKNLKTTVMKKLKVVKNYMKVISLEQK